MRKKLVSIILSIMVAVTFMPLAADYTFAVEGDQGQNVEQPEQVETPETPPQFNGGKVGGIRVAGYTYKSVYIAWTGVSQAKGYQVFRANKKKGKYKLIRTVGSTGFNDTGNKSMSKYKYYKVRAYGTVNGKTVYGAYSGIFRAKPALPPAQNVRTSGGSGKITCAWNKVAGAKKYQVYRATSRNGKYSKIKTTKSCSYTKSATTGKRYYFKVRAVRGKKKSGFSAIAEGLPTAPGPSSVTATQSNEAIQITWSGVAQAYAYEVYRSTELNSGYAYIAGVNGTSYLDTKDLENGTQYFYKVRALTSVNGKAQAGYFSSNNSASRNAVITVARSYMSIKERSTKHKDIVNTYNGSASGGKIGYGDAWCAAFVSAIAIKTGNGSRIPLYAYCPTMLKKFSNKTKNKSYHPDTADVIFFDWNKNDVPDHVGFVDNYNPATNIVTTIEGNCSDTVKCRTFTPGKYSYLLAYGLPAYPIASAVTYTIEPTPTEEIQEAAALVTEAEVKEVTEQVMNPEAEPADEAMVETEAASVEEVAETEAAVETEEVAEAPETDYDKVVAVAEVVQEEQPAAEVAAEESTYDAFLVKEACEDLGIEACVVTEIDANGEMTSYNEIVIDGQIYVLDASEGAVPEEYVPEEIN